jgi:predicted transcriptional regulator
MVTSINFFTKPIKYCMKLSVITLKGDSRVSEALDLMRDKNSGCVTVLLDDDQLGIATERDMVFRVLAQSKDPGTTRLKEVATRNPITVSKSSSLENALRVMRDKGLQRLIVINKEKKPVGMLDQNMFFSALVNFLLEEPGITTVCKGFIGRHINEIVERYPDAY